jgi:hypothetical protein
MPWVGLQGCDLGARVLVESSLQLSKRQEPRRTLILRPLTFPRLEKGLVTVGPGKRDGPGGALSIGQGDSLCASPTPARSAGLPRLVGPSAPKTLGVCCTPWPRAGRGVRLGVYYQALNRRDRGGGMHGPNPQRTPRHASSCAAVGLAAQPDGPKEHLACPRGTLRNLT